MKGDPYTKEVLERAKVVEASFRVKPGLYLIGSLERGVTVYNQQLRAHNLVWALWELHKEKTSNIKTGKVAIVGGGIAGLTAAACFLSRFERISVTVFEQLWDLCPLQQGADNRWLHPRIYEWPAPGSRSPSASLPVLDWSEGRASDVARKILSEFGEFSKAFGASEERLNIFLGLRHFRINATKNEIDWIANKAERNGAFFHTGETQGDSLKFDTIVLAVGFGLETQSPDYPTDSYWRNEQHGQPILNGSRQNYVVSGFGDGALIDLCRLTIERFRQDTILLELFQDDLITIEERFAEALEKLDKDANLFKLFRKFERIEIFNKAKRELSNRIRKDTRVALHISGKDGKVTTFPYIFGPYSSFLNRMLVFLLYRCGAFSISFKDLKSTVSQHGAPRKNVLCRHGADALGHLQTMFVDFDSVKKRFAELKKYQEQSPQQFWVPGTFPRYS